MNDIKQKIIEKFGNRLRIRVCGICVNGNNILMVNHHSLNLENDFWGPPGGGMEFGISAEENLKREFMEETGLEIEVEKLLFSHEYLSPPLHAIELIFKVRQIGGSLKVGTDPEMEIGEQIIKNVKFINFSDLKAMPENSVHQLFKHIVSIKELMDLNGFYQLKR